MSGVIKNLRAAFIYKDKFIKKEELILDGFTSTSESINVALGFMFQGLKKGDVPVLYKIIGVK